MLRASPQQKKELNSFKPDGFAIQIHHFPQIWFLVVTFAMFGVYVAWDLNFLTTIFALDRSYVTSIIAVLVVLSTSHAAWNIFSFSRRIEAANLCLTDPTDPRIANQDDGFVSAFMVKFQNSTLEYSGRHSADQDSEVEIFADRLRSPVDLGWYLVDLTVRLGLVGTIIGFILIFSSLSGSTIGGAEGLKGLLVTMSGGMGTALFTTLGGLVGATFLSLQYLILGREAEHLVGLLIRLRYRCPSRRDY